MKTTLKVALASLMLSFAGANAQVAVSGGAVNVPAQVAAVNDAVKAQEVATEFVRLTLDVPTKDVKTVTKEMTGNAAVVIASTPAKTCELQLLRNPTANKQGWVVQNYSCNTR